MTILDRVRGLIERLAPEPVCDTCIVEKLGLSDHDHVDQISRELAGRVQFERDRTACALCGQTRPVIRRR